MTALNVSFDRTYVDRTYVDLFKFYFITGTHENRIINFYKWYIYKWYISNSFHNKKPLIWDGFIKQVKLFLLGEKDVITQTLEVLLPRLGNP